MSVGEIITTNGYQSRKLLLCLILILTGWVLAGIISIDKLKPLLDFTMYMFGIYAGANVGSLFIKPKALPAPAAIIKPSDAKGD